MPTIRISYNNEEISEATESLRIDEYRAFIWDFSQWLRNEVKHGDKPYQEVKDKFWEMFNKRELKELG